MKNKFTVLVGIVMASILFTNCKKSSKELPIVDAGIDQTITFPNDSVLLTGYGRDANGIVISLTYKWTKISGPGSVHIVQPNNTTTIVRNLSEGSYQFELKVTSVSGQSATDHVTITVLPGASPAVSNSIGALSINRWGVAAAAAGNKILFAGGSWGETNPSIFSRVDIYDTNTNTWSTAELSEARVGMGAVTVGNKILFAGGARNFDYNIGWHSISKRVDIYDVLTNTWTTTELPREQLFLSAFGVATAAGTKAYFYSHYNSSSHSNEFYVFDVANGDWSTMILNGPVRFGNAIGALDNKIFFAGGFNLDVSDYLQRVDIYNISTNAWTLSPMSEPRDLIKSTTVNNKILFAGGQNPVGDHKSTVDIYDNSSQTWSVAQLTKPAVLAGAASTGQKAIFFNGAIVDVYDASSNTWSVVNINISVEFDASVIIASGNSVYVAGAKVNGAWMNQVWKLVF